MRPRPQIVAAVLATFVTTTAMPGRQVVVHSHADGDHEHAHASLEHEALAHHEHDDDHHHDHDHHEDHDVGLTAADHGPLAHTHVTSPFHPATPPAPPTVGTAVRVTASPAATQPVPPVRETGRARSRAPPPSARA